MDGKNMILLGLGASALYMYFCISTHKDQVYAELNPSPVSTVTNQTNELVKNGSTTLTQIPTEKIASSFSFNNTKPYTFKARLAEKEKNQELVKHINQWCATQSCQKEIEFLDNVKEVAWTAPTLTLMNHMLENDIKDGSITVKENHIIITGDLANSQSAETMKNLLANFGSDIQVDNQTKIVEVAKTVVVQENNNSSITPTVKAIPEESNTQEALTAEGNDKQEQLKEIQTKIDELLKNAVINFKFNSSTLVPSSQKILDDIVALVNQLTMQVDIKIEGHTDASGNANYNKQLSQKRADSVKKHLLQHKINARKITSTGFGEEKLIYAPNDKKNRRVEIYLTKGE